MREVQDSSGYFWDSSGIFIKYMPAAIIATSLFVMAFVANSLGFVSPDSWNYLRLAESFSKGDGCSIGGEYFAVFPCGYPALISLTSWATSLDLFSSSKLLNVFALALSVFFVYQATKNFLLGVLILLNPITLAIGHYTWSENAFLLAVSLVFYASTKAFYGSSGLKLALPILAGLLVGVTSRYFFGPYAFLMFISIWLVYGRLVAVRVFPYFAIAGIVFFGYYVFNKVMTGHGSGMPRIPSPESLVFLFAHFVKYSVKQLVIYAAALSPLMIFCVYFFFSKRGLVRRRGAFSFQSLRSYDYAPLILMMVFGAFYLLLSFGMRVYAQYDLYGYRTVGYGFVFFVSAAVVMATKLSGMKFGMRGMLAIFGVAVFSIFLSQRGAYLGFLSDSRGESYEISFHESIDGYGADLDVRGVVVPFSVPSPKWSVSPNPDLFYKDGVKVLVPYTAPYRERESFEEFSRRLISEESPCYYDFTRVESDFELEKILGAQYPIDISFSESFLSPVFIKDFRYDQAVSSHIRELFLPGRLVECGAYNPSE